MKKRTDFWCRLWINTDDDSPHDITKITGITPSLVEVKGDPLKSRGNNRMIPNKQFETNIWIYDSKKQYADSEYEIYKSVEDILAVLAQSENAFGPTISKYQHRGLIICCNTHRYWVQTIIPSDIIKQIAEYSISLELSILTIDDSVVDDN